MIAEIVSLPLYESHVADLLTEDERSAMEYFIALAPEAHPVIPRSGGFRKARWALSGRGKRGGVRAIYYFISPPGQIFMAHIYSKSQKENLSANDLKALNSLAAQIKLACRKEH